MRNKHPVFVVFSLVSVIIFSACNQPAPRQTTNPNLVYTSGAETVIARLTGTPGTQAATLVTQPSQATATVAPPPNSHTPTSTLAPSETPTPTATNTAIPTAPAGDPRELLGIPDWEDNFETGAGWPMIDDDHAEMSLKEGELRMEAHNPDMWDSWMIALPKLSDFYLEMTARTGQCEAKDHYGMIVRTSDGTAGYLYSFSCDGEFSLRIWDGEKLTTLVDWTSSEYILKGSQMTNRMGLMAKGERLSLYANGSQLTEVIDSSYMDGRFGVLVGSGATVDFKTFVSQIAYWVLE